LKQLINIYNLELIYGTVTCSAGIGRHVHAMTFPEVGALHDSTSPNRAARDLDLAALTAVSFDQRRSLLTIAVRPLEGPEPFGCTAQKSGRKLGTGSI
jgi:hypothetical protein